MNFLPEEIDRYAENHTTDEPLYLQQLRRETWQKIVNPRMLSGPLQGRFLAMVSRMIKPKRILEIGTYTGYSALCLAEGLTPDGELITIDLNDELRPIQEKYISLSPFARQITLLTGDATELIQQLDPSFDLVFIDADKSNYQVYYNYLLERLPAGSFLLLDNVLWSGKVLTEPDPSDLETQVLITLNDHIKKDHRVVNVLLPIRDGLMLVQKS